MSNSREVSQFSNFIVVDDSNRNIGIATTATPYVGIGTTNPQYKLDVVGDLNFTGTLRQNGSEYSSGIQNVVEDTTPQLGGNLDLNGKTIDGTGGINITGVVTATSFIGNLTGTATTATNLADAANITTGTISDDRLPAIISSDITGNAATATTAGTATTATNSTVTTSSTNSAFKVPFANTTANTTGNYGLLQDSDTNLTYNPSTNTLTVSNLSGTATNATNANVTTSTTNSAFKIPFANTTVSTTGNYGLLQDSTATFTYNPSTNRLTVDNISGSTINVSGASTLGQLQIISGIVTATTGIVTYYGDGSNLTGVSAAGSAAGYQFNVGITSIISTQLTAIGSNILTLPSTSGKRYIIHSINASNVAAGNTDVNVIGAFDISGGERSYFAYNIPIPTGTSVELLKQPQVLNPSDAIVMRGTDYNRDGSDDAVQVYISYEVKDDTNYFGVGVGTVGIALTDPTTIYTSTTYPSVIQSIRLANRTDTGGYPVSVTITSGVTTTYLIDDLIVPKYSSVEILDTPKAMSINDTIQVIVDQTETIDVQVSGIKVT